MVIQEYDKVRIVASGVTGVVVDIFESKGEKIYVVEDDEWKDGGYPLYDCKVEEITRINHSSSKMSRMIASL